MDRALAGVALVVVLGAVMSILDATVVNVALNTLTHDFHSPLSTIQWVATGYTLALAAVIPLTGWAADRFGTKRLYMTAILLFILGSALCGFAQSANQLIFFRVLQGLGGGMLMPVGMTKLTRAAGPQRITRVMTLIGIPMMVAPVCGPILGGWLVDAYSWRWIFYINIPLGLITFALSMYLLPKDVSQPHHSLDWLGLLLLSPGLAALIYGLAQTGSSSGFASPQVYFPAGAGLLALVLFTWHSLRAEDPILDVRLFANRTFAASSVTTLLMTIAIFGGLLLTPLYLQIVRQQSAFDTGVEMIPQGLGAMMAMPIAGRLADRFGVGRVAPVGLALSCSSFLALAHLGAGTPLWKLSAALLFMGLGMGATMMPITSGAMQTLAPSQVARGTTAINITQRVGTSVGTAVLSVILIHQIANRLHGTQGLNASASVPAAEMHAVVRQLADSFDATYWYALGLAGAALLVAAALLPKGRQRPASGAALASAE